MKITRTQIKKLVNEAMNRKLGKRLNESMASRALEDMGDTLLEVIFDMQREGLDNESIMTELTQWVRDTVRAAGGEGGYTGGDGEEVDFANVDRESMEDWEP